jgi:hypothetical protein
MSLRDLAQWLADTEWSIALHESQYAYATIESIHVWALCLFVGFAVLLDLRLVSAIFRDVPVSHMVRRLLPWTKVGFAVMVVSGILLFYAIPLRTYLNIFFRIKVVLLMLAGLNAFVFHRGIYRMVSEWDVGVPPPRQARRAGIYSLALWAAIVFSGRLIAYNWFDCGKLQPGLVNTLAGCTAEDVDPYQ